MRQLAIRSSAIPAPAQQSKVSPGFFQAYVAHVFPLKKIYYAPRDCLAALKAPDLASQTEIIRKFEDLSMEHTIDGLEGLVLVLLMRDEHEKLEEVLTAADVYYLTLDFLRTMVQEIQREE